MRCHWSRVLWAAWALAQQRRRSAPADPVAPAAPAQPAVGPNYIVGPGDTLQIFVWRNPELTTTVPVRPDGKITTPLVQDMVAVGKTPSQLAKDIETVLAEYIRSPQVNVIVVEPGERVQPGQGHRPGDELRSRCRIATACACSTRCSPAAVSREFAAGNRAKIVRKERTARPTELQVRVADLMNKGDMQSQPRAAARRRARHSGVAILMKELVDKITQAELRGAWRFRRYALVTAWGVCLLGWFVVSRCRTPTKRARA